MVCSILSASSTIAIMPAKKRQKKAAMQAQEANATGPQHI
jgi:hypothetical protein